jgi:hypothetical protein
MKCSLYLNKKSLRPVSYDDSFDDKELIFDEIVEDVKDKGDIFELLTVEVIFRFFRLLIEELLLDELFVLVLMFRLDSFLFKFSCVSSFFG